MNRRQFLGAATRTAAGAGAIGWLSHYFLGEPARADEDAKVAAMGNVGDAYRRASILGKPVLVLVIPEKNDARYQRGETFGSLLNHGGTGAYLDLALCEIVCATVADTRRQLDGLKIEGEPLMLLVETDGVTPRATPLDPQIGDARAPRKGGFEKLDEYVKERLDKVVASVRAAVAPDRKTLEARAALAESRLPADEVDAVKAAVAAGKTPRPEALARAAAIVRARAEEAARAEILDALAAATETRVKGPAPAGAKWAKSSGCGVEVEGEESPGIACGMGYTPAICRRFLWFFTQ